ncbi:class I SAM-dependent methyltransferase [Thalassolituus sp.]|jgi:2-polyprenyl-3-methyl-5-hydroxy-6-metoxy-1,4-benzoquinol methylase|uniref:class I SAM-dependent methyltransferase n=1 Tax=Thalassolituus sp. TaxID=2030822 RepID=UPI0032D8BCE4
MNIATHIGPACPLCNEENGLTPIRASDKRTYFACLNCHLAFVDPADYLTADEEMAYYATHENRIEDEGYVRFLQNVTTPLLALIPNEQKTHLQGLDYGCGPGPTLSILLEREGIACDNYDPFFADIQLKTQYDVITATECFEHFHQPAQELTKLTKLLAPNGYLALMTSRWKTEQQFANWHYTRDPTHVVFMHDKTISYIAERYGVTPVWQDDRRVVIFQR